MDILVLAAVAVTRAALPELREDRTGAPAVVDARSGFWTVVAAPTRARTLAPFVRIPMSQTGVRVREVGYTGVRWLRTMALVDTDGP